MKALVLEDYKRLELRDVPSPPLSPDDVLVSVKACGICGSDVHGFDGSSGRRRPPIIMGHEAAGMITKVGENVETWRPGDRVTFDSTIYCNACDACRSGQINLCVNRRVFGVSCEGYRQNGAFAEFVAVPQHLLFRLPDSLDYRHAAMVEPLSIAFHAVRRARASADRSAVVVGAGIIGLLVIQALRLQRCRQIIAVDIAPDKLDIAKTLGATALVDSSAPNAVDSIRSLAGGKGADVAFEAVGIPPTLDLAIRSVRDAGSVALIGNVTPQVPIPLQIVVGRELTLYGSCASCGEYATCLDAIAKGDIQIGPLITATAPLSEGPQWFDRLYGREPGLLKIILQPAAVD
jgi:L-iditol 2-dehydrogenase